MPEIKYQANWSKSLVVIERLNPRTHSIDATSWNYLLLRYRY